MLKKWLGKRKKQRDFKREIDQGIEDGRRAAMLNIRYPHGWGRGEIEAS